MNPGSAANGGAAWRPPSDNPPRSEKTLIAARRFRWAHPNLRKIPGRLKPAQCPASLGHPPRLSGNPGRRRYPAWDGCRAGPAWPLGRNPPKIAHTVRSPGPGWAERHAGGSGRPGGIWNLSGSPAPGALRGTFTAGNAPHHGPWRVRDYLMSAKGDDDVAVLVRLPSCAPHLGQIEIRRGCGGDQRTAGRQVLCDHQGVWWRRPSSGWSGPERCTARRGGRRYISSRGPGYPAHEMMRRPCRLHTTARPFTRRRLPYGRPQPSDPGGSRERVLLRLMGHRIRLPAGARPIQTACPGVGCAYATDGSRSRTGARRVRRPKSALPDPFRSQD